MTGEAPGIDGIAFDLYGTLLTVGERAVQRAARQHMGAHGAAWVATLRSLLVTPCASAGEFAERLAAALPGPAKEARAALEGALARELGSVTPARGVRALLHFWKRRGLKLGLLSNLAAPYKAPCEAFGLAELLDAALYSCDEGCAKPAAVLYERLCERLGVPADRVLFVGDSGPNDVEAPRRAGMRTAAVGAPGGDVALADVAGLGLLRLADGSLERLLAPGESVTLGASRFTMRAIEPVEDDDQGRYNLVFRIAACAPEGAEATLYAKRFLLPETAFTEQLGHLLQKATGLAAVEVAVLTSGGEPMLLLSEAPGTKFDGVLTEEVAYDLGGHSVFAFLFANADFRPRNAFLSGSRLAMLDMEHCLFNLALDVEGLADPLRPETFDRMAPEELAARTKKRVLTPLTTRRARRAFFGDTPRSSPLIAAWHEGFLAFYGRVNTRREELLDLLRRRIHEEPPIVVGTQAYRRALADVDVADVDARLRMDPEEAFEWCY